MSTLRNRVQLIGYLGLDPEVKTLESGSKLARLRLATSESYKLSNGEWKDETTWHNIVAWEKLAERAEAYFHKGSHLMIEGKLVNRSWVDTAGVKKYVTEIRAVNIIMLDKKADESGSDPVAQDIPEEVNDDGLPF